MRLSKLFVKLGWPGNVELFNTNFLDCIVQINYEIKIRNTLVTSVGPGGSDWTLAVRKGFFLSQPNSTQLYSSWSDNAIGPWPTTPPETLDHFQGTQEADFW